MKEYLKEPVEEKLFYSQYEDVTKSLASNDDEYKEVEKEMLKMLEEVSTFVNNNVSLEKQKEFLEILNKCEFAIRSTRTIFKFLLLQARIK